MFRMQFVNPSVKLIKKKKYYNTKMSKKKFKKYYYNVKKKKITIFLRQLFGNYLYLMGTRFGLYYTFTHVSITLLLLFGLNG